MDKLVNFIKSNEVDFTKNLVTENELNEILIQSNIKIGSQLKAYILTYGYLGYESYELYGINSKQKTDSDMISQTKYLNKYFDSSIGFIALENLGEGSYILVNSEDQIFILETENNTMKSKNMKLEEYILERFGN